MAHCKCEGGVDPEFSKRLIRDDCGSMQSNQCLVVEGDGCSACNQKSLETTVCILTGVTPTVEMSSFDLVGNNGTESERLEDLDQTTDDVKMITALKNVVPHQTQHPDYKSKLPVNVLENPKTQKKKNSPKKCPSRSSNASKCKVKRKPLLIPGYVTISDSTPKYTCTLCKKSFTTRLHIRYHSYCNGSSKPYKCEKCNQEFITKSHYQYHLRNHEGRRPYVCNKCGKAYNQQGKLTRHTRSHVDEKTFVCSTCGHRFKNLDGLKSHSKIHLGLKPHQCTLCIKAFSELANLKKHAISHKGEKNFMCDECGKSFVSKSTLNAHIQTHSKVRPHVCNSCGRAFTSNKDLKRHSTIHLSFKPFNCQLCTQAFRRKDNFDRHMKNTHPDSSLPPIIQPLPKDLSNEPLQSVDLHNSRDKQTNESPGKVQISRIEKCSSDLKTIDNQGILYPNGHVETHSNMPNYTLQKLDNFSSNTLDKVETEKDVILPSENLVDSAELNTGTENVSQTSQASIIISAKDINDSKGRTAVCQAVPVINRNTGNSPHQKNNMGTSSIIKMGTSLARSAYDGTNCVRTITCTSNIQRNQFPPNVPTIVSPINLKQAEMPLKADDKSPTGDQNVAKELSVCSDSTDIPAKPKLRLYLSDLHWRKRTMELLNLRNELKADSLIYDKSLEKVDDIEEGTQLNNPVTHSERIEFCNSPKNNNSDDHGTYYSKQTFYKVSDQPGEILVRGTQQKYLPHNRLRHIHPKSIDYHEPSRQPTAAQSTSIAATIVPAREDQHVQIITPGENGTPSQANKVIVENKTGNVRIG